MAKQRWGILPKTTCGASSVGLVVVMPILFFIGIRLRNALYSSVPAGRTVLEDIATRPALALTMLAGMLAGVLAFAVGLLAIVKEKDRAILVYFSTIIGLLVILFLLAEVAFPH